MHTVDADPLDALIDTKNQTTAWNGRDFPDVKYPLPLSQNEMELLFHVHTRDRRQHWEVWLLRPHVGIRQYVRKMFRSGVPLRATIERYYCQTPWRLNCIWLCGRRRSQSEVARVCMYVSVTGLRLKYTDFFCTAKRYSTYGRQTTAGRQETWELAVVWSAS